jgi:hypothetical protein
MTELYITEKNSHSVPTVGFTLPRSIFAVNKFPEGTV